MEYTGSSAGEAARKFAERLATVVPRESVADGTGQVPRALGTGRTSARRRVCDRPASCLAMKSIDQRSPALTSPGRDLLTHQLRMKTPALRVSESVTWLAIDVSRSGRVPRIERRLARRGRRVNFSGRRASTLVEDGTSHPCGQHEWCIFDIFATRELVFIARA